MSEDSLQFLLVLPDICEYHHSIWCLFKQHILVAFFSLITYKSNNTKRGLSHVSSYYLPSFSFDSTDSRKASLKWWKEWKPKWPPSQQYKTENQPLLRLHPLPSLAAGARRHPANDTPCKWRLRSFKDKDKDSPVAWVTVGKAWLGENLGFSDSVTAMIMRLWQLTALLYLISADVKSLLLSIGFDQIKSENSLAENLNISLQINRI